MQWLGLARSDQLCHLAVGVILPPKETRSEHTGDNTGRVLAVLDPIQTEPTFVRNTAFLIEGSRLVRTSYLAIFAANTQLFVDHHYTVIATICGSRGTNLGTGGIRAVLTLDGQKAAVDPLALG